VTRFVGFDLETTGISPFRDIPVSYGFVEHEAGHTGEKVQSRSGFINPGVPIPAGAAAIHGITDDMVATAMPVGQAAEFLASELTSLWADGAVIVGMNVSYDLTMVQSLCEREGVPTLDVRGTIGPVLDVLILDRRFDKWRKGARKLTDLCRLYGVTLDGAHSAAEDAEASLQVLEAIVLKYPEISAIEPSNINEVLGEWYREWLSSFSTFLERKGEPPIGQGRYPWPLHSGE
jgi:DNA polymerase-3 subunit epsilon